MGLAVDVNMPIYAELNDNYSSAAYVYFCEAPVGSLTSAAVWRISRLTIATGKLEWASNGAFACIADNRASLTYA